MSQAKECWSCYFYKPYYTKGFCTFQKERVGRCCRQMAYIDDKHHTCDKWRKIVRIPELRRGVALKKLNESVDILSEIKQILLEDLEESSSLGRQTETINK